VGGIVAAAQGPDTWFGTGFADVETRTHALVADPSGFSDEDNGGGGSKIRIGRSHSYATGFEPSAGGAFMGVARAEDIEQYLDGVAREYVTDIEEHPLVLHTNVVEGQRTPSPPGDEQFWIAQTTGVERQTIKWRISDDQVVVLMRPDGSAGLAGRIAFSTGLEYYTALAIVVGGVGTVMFIAGIGLLFEAVGPALRGKPRPEPEPPIEIAP
jgi:hypothetical protein